MALGIALVAGLGAGELFVRAMVGAPGPERLPLLEMRAHPTRGWSMVPNKVHYTYHHRVHVNALGLRGPDVGPVQPGRPRVLALGDSLIYGQGVGDQETLPACLETVLCRNDPAGRTWQVVNAGHRAYDTLQELALLEELGPLLQPEVVVLFWYWNDVRESDASATYARLADRGPVAFDTGARMEGTALLSWQFGQLLRRSALAMYLHDALKLGEDALVEDPAAREAALARLDDQLTRLRSTAEALGSMLVFCAVPDRHTLLGEHPSSVLSQRAQELAARHGIDTIDLAPALRDLARSTGRIPELPFDGHYTPEANCVMAEVVAAHLLAL